MVFLLFWMTGTVFAGEQGETPNIKGEWSIILTFVAGKAHHTVIIDQDGERLSGIYKGEFKEGPLRGTIKGNTIDFTGFLKHEATGVSFHYSGTISGTTMQGTVDMGEYWTATWTAERKKKDH